ncbi:MAG: D-alanine--D-alanine ligase family protein [Eubacteriales bacterium]|nr:D-alanine--D-alanine ligase family protein [Eubacteriales bacterium]
MRQNLAIIFGGKAAEYPISLLSATNVISSCRQLADYHLFLIGISHEGVFYEYVGPDEAIATDEWHRKPEWLRPIVFQPQLCRGYWRQEQDQSWNPVCLDLVFPVLHGQDGEGGPLQGFLDTLGLNYVGCGQLAAALMMDKAFANQIFEQAGFRQAAFTSFKAQDLAADPGLATRLIAEAGIDYPLFVKPANTGSSFGISKVTKVEELDAALDLAKSFDDKILIEQGIIGRELEVAVLERKDGSVVASLAGEIIPGKEFYDYQDKYAADSASSLCIPATLTEEQMEEIRSMAVEAFKCCDCQGLARVDFFLREADQAIYINEINTMPGFTAISMYPKLWEAAGLPQKELMAELLQVANKKRS